MLEEEEKKEIPTVSELKRSFFSAVTSTFKSYKIGDLLVASKLITPEDLDRALVRQKETGEQLGKILIYQEALSTLQLHKKLAEQWCLKAAAAGLTIVLQSASPSFANTTAFADKEPNFITSAFTLTSTNQIVSSDKMTSIDKTGLFGTKEIKSDDITAFTKWTNAIERFEEQIKTHVGTSPRMQLWKTKIRSLQNKSEIEKIRSVNGFINRTAYIEDTENYGTTDYWATPIEFISHGGDCEDFAIAKYASLRALGFSSNQMRIAIVQDKIKNMPHAVLIVYTKDGSFVLDNQSRKAEITAAVSRYKPIFSINSDSWWLHQV